jgi:hypothetical protein
MKYLKITTRLIGNRQRRRTKGAQVVDDCDARAVVDTASALHVSEFEVFRLAYHNWFGRPGDEKEIDASFHHYMDKAIVPMWVRDFTRRIQQLRDDDRLDVHELGIDPLPPTNAWMIFVGGMAFAFMLMILALLVYLAMRVQDTVPAGCQLPPCY